ncbi:MAG: FIST N-terminal domain-containing protein [Acidimicrobiales bacterium]
MTGRFGAAISEHPLITHATGEVVGQVLDAVGEAPDVAIVFVTGPNMGALEDISAAIRSTLQPGILLGVTAVSVVGNQREVEETAAISLWAGRISGLTPVRLDARRNSDGWAIAGFPDGVGAGTLLLLADPFSIPVDGLLEHLRHEVPELVVVGGLASASGIPGGNRLVLDDQIHDSGAVGVIVPPGVVTPVVSQGCRPVGEPFTITSAEHTLVAELGGRPAMDRIQELIDNADDETRSLMQHGLHLGVVVNEQQVDFRRGDFLIRGVMGVDRSSGAVVVGDRLDVGQTVQFQVRDASTADEDLRELLRGKSAASCLLFTCSARGSQLFDVPDHDADMIYEALDGAPMAGLFCAGEIGPVGDRNYMQGFTASLALLD